MDASQTRSAADPETIMYHNKNNNAQKRLSPSLADTGDGTPGMGTSKPRNRADPTYKSKQSRVCFGAFVLLLWEANEGDESDGGVSTVRRENSYIHIHPEKKAGER